MVEDHIRSVPRANLPCNMITQHSSSANDAVDTHVARLRSHTDRISCNPFVPLQWTAFVTVNSHECRMFAVCGDVVQWLREGLNL